MPDKVFNLLDFERIGLEHRQSEGGVIVKRTMDHPGGYVEQHEELLEVYKTLDLEPKTPDHATLAETLDGSQIEFPFPENASMGTEPVHPQRGGMEMG